MRILVFLLLLVTCVVAQPPAPAPGTSGFGKPAVISTEDLSGFSELPADRRKLIESAIAVAKDSPWLPYTVGSGDPAQGGFDCSGAMYFVMRKCKLDPPRSSGTQLRWLREKGRFIEVPADATSVDHPSLKKLSPGDLLFWGHIDEAAKEPRINHVAMYLGTEKKDGLAVMINSTDGRSYRGVQANGYGVYDFRLPKAGGTTVFLGYGTPPGIAEIPE
jgi:cell wall-associated NlpC family hydrolase